MEQFQSVLFDFDGTIMNTGEGITKAAAYALRQYGIEVEDLSSLRPFVGPPLPDSFTRFYGFGERQSWEAAEKFREYYETRGIEQCEPYGGIGDLLRSLKASGRTVLLATSKPQVFARRILERWELLDYFDAVCGAAKDGTHSDKDRLICAALSQGGGDPERAVMVGDRKFDILGAKKAGVRSIGVLYGFGDRAELEAAGADALAQDVAALSHLLSAPIAAAKA